MRVLVIYGSLRTLSINKALAEAARELAPDGMTIQLTGVSGLSLYNEDQENPLPKEAADLKEKIRLADGVIIATPEFNRGMPGPLKNALDWVSRPSGEHPWGEKPVGVIGASSGPRGAVTAQYDVKRMMLYFGAHVMGTPEFYVDNSDKKIDGGVVRDEQTKEYLQRYLAAFKAHVERFR